MTTGTDGVPEGIGVLVVSKTLAKLIINLKMVRVIVRM